MVDSIFLYVFLAFLKTAVAINPFHSSLLKQQHLVLLWKSNANFLSVSFYVTQQDKQGKFTLQHSCLTIRVKSLEVSFQAKSFYQVSTWELTKNQLPVVSHNKYSFRETFQMQLSTCKCFAVIRHGLMVSIFQKSLIVSVTARKIQPACRLVLKLESKQECDCYSRPGYFIQWIDFLFVKLFEPASSHDKMSLKCWEVSAISALLCHSRWLHCTPFKWPSPWPFKLIKRKSSINTRANLHIFIH